MDAVLEAVEEYNMHRLLRSVCISCRSCTIRLSRGRHRAFAGSWAGNSGMHHYIRMQLSAQAPSPSRPGNAGRHLISALFRRAVSSGAMCGSRGPPQASSSPLGAYSSPAAHPITPHNLTSPLYFPLSTYSLVEHPAKQYTKRLDRVRGHHMTRISYLHRR